MKRVFYIATLVSVLIALSVYGYQDNQRCDKIGSNIIELSEVEALGNAEISYGVWIVTVYSPTYWECHPGGGASCPGSPW